MHLGPLDNCPKFTVQPQDMLMHYHSKVWPLAGPAHYHGEIQPRAMLAEPLLREERSGRAQGVNTSNIENDPESVDCCALIPAVHNQKINTTPPFNLMLEHPTPWPRETRRIQTQAHHPSRPEAQRPSVEPSRTNTPASANHISEASIAQDLREWQCLRYARVGRRRPAFGDPPNPWATGSG